MFLHVEVSSDPVIPGKSGISAKTNSPYSIPSKQRAALHFGGSFPHPFEVDVPDSGPYRPGRYVLAGDEIVRPGERGPMINLRGCKLVPFEEAAKAMTGDLAKIKAA